MTYEGNSFELYQCQQYEYDLLDEFNKDAENSMQDQWFFELKKRIGK